MSFEQKAIPASDAECEEVRDLLYLFVCQELEPSDVDLVVRHLARCKPCQEALIQHTKLAKHLGKAVGAVPVDYFAINV